MQMDTLPREVGVDRMKQTSVRHQIPATETMKKYFADIERNVFAAEILCEGSYDMRSPLCTGSIDDCPFNQTKIECELKWIRSIIGEQNPGPSPGLEKC